MPHKAAIFDVDRTLVDGMTGHLFTRFLWKRRMLPLRNRLRIACVVAGYRSNILREERLVEIGVTGYAGLRIDDLKEAAQQCTEAVLRPRIFTEALEAIESHRKKGDLILLASGSSDLVVGALAEYVKGDCFAATSAKAADGISTLNVNRPLCYKEGKRALIQKILEKHGIALKDCSLYSDNDVDIPIFHEAAHGYAVNPHAVLREKAERNGWEILRWSTPLEPRFKVTGTSWPVKSRGRP